MAQNLEFTSRQEAMMYLLGHYGVNYEFTPPAKVTDKWRAKAKFGDHQELEEWTASDLLDAVQDHDKRSKGAHNL